MTMNQTNMVITGNSSASEDEDLWELMPKSNSISRKCKAKATKDKHKPQCSNRSTRSRTLSSCQTQSTSMKRSAKLGNVIVSKNEKHNIEKKNKRGKGSTKKRTECKNSNKMNLPTTNVFVNCKSPGPACPSRSLSLTPSSSSQSDSGSAQSGPSIQPGPSGQSDPYPHNYCPFCQMPFSLVMLQSPRWHVTECMDLPFRKQPGLFFVKKGL